MFVDFFFVCGFDFVNVYVFGVFVIVDWYFDGDVVVVVFYFGGGEVCWNFFVVVLGIMVEVGFLFLDGGVGLGDVFVEGIGFWFGM